MFKKRIKQEWWKIWPTGTTVRIHADNESCWRPSRLAHHDDLRSSQWRSLRNYIGPPSSDQLGACSNILSDASSGWPPQSQQASFTALSSREVFMFQWIQLSFINKAQAINSLFPNCHVKKSACFYELRFGRISLNKSFSFYIRDFKTIKVSNSTGRLAYQFVRSCRLLNLLFDIFDSFSVLFNQSYYLNHFDKDSNWIIVACFMRA